MTLNLIKVLSNMNCLYFLLYTESKFNIQLIILLNHIKKIQYVSCYILYINASRIFYFLPLFLRYTMYLIVHHAGGSKVCFTLTSLFKVVKTITGFNIHVKYIHINTL